MAQLPTRRAREIADALAKLGFVYECTTGGNHLRFRHPLAKTCIHAAGSPSDNNAIRWLESKAKRILREEGIT